MKKSEVLELGKNIAKNAFKKYGTIKEDDVFIIGLKECDERYVMLFGWTGNLDVICRIYYNKDTRKIRTDFYEKVNK